METRWFRRLGPGVAALAAVAAIASTTAGAPPPTWDPPDCPGPPGVGDRPVGAWFRLDPTIVDGTYSGQRLTMGRADIESSWRMELDPESFATEPTRGTLLVGTDDGRASTLSLLDLGAACAWGVGASRDVVRGAVIAPDGRSIVESRVDRRTRADLGVWRRPLDGGAPIRILPPIPPDDRFGPTWVTGLEWSQDGSSLVVASCGEVACRYRVLVAWDGAPMTIADPTLGSLVGSSEGRLVVHGACRGLPCPLVSVDLHGATGTTLDAAAGPAVMAHDEGGEAVVVHETGDGGLRSIRPDGADGRPLASAPDGLRLVADVAWSASAAEHPADGFLLAPDGRVPLDGPRRVVMRSTHSALTIPLAEVLR